MSMYTPFTYTIQSKTTGLKYYGSRYGKKAHPDTLWTTYFTSSKQVHNLISKYGADDFIAVIDKTFETLDECCKYETEYITKNNCVYDPSWLNCGNWGGQYYSPNRSDDFTPKWRRKLSEAATRNTNRAKDYWIIHPDGTEELIHNLANFCRQHKLNHSALHGVANGKRNHHHGFKMKLMQHSRLKLQD